MKITEKWLVSKGACLASVEAFKNQTETDSLKILNKLLSKGKIDWANWLIARVMTYPQYVSYAVFGAEQVVGLYEKKYPNDNRPRLAIDAAKKCIKNPTKKNKMVAAAYAADATDATYAAYDAVTYRRDVRATYLGQDVAKTAADVAKTAANAAVSAAYAADAAGVASAAVSAAYAADVAGVASAAAKTKLKILKYGITLLKEK